MNKHGHVLVVDDAPEWREQLVETLQRGGYQVDAASTAAEALEKLNEAPYHVLVLDIRMEENDLSNVDGIDMLEHLDKHGLTHVTRVIMLSAYATKEQMRLAFRDYNVADFISKSQFDNQVFLENVQQVFSQKVNINLRLEILWQPHGGGSEEVVLDLSMDGTIIRRDTALQQQIAVELEDLLCRLFRQAESILVRPLTAGQSGTRVLRVQPFYTTGGGGHEVVVKFGDFHKIEEEHHKFKDYVQPFFGGGRTTTVLDIQRTTHLGGIIYSLLGTTNDLLVDFGEFYRHADFPQIKDALDRLFWDTCGDWYANRGHLQPLDLAKDYQRLLEYTPGMLEQIVAEQLPAVQIKEKLSFNQLKNKRTFTIPWLATAGLSLVLPTYVCITHGDFNHHNLLVDKTGNMWMIDFQGTGQSHILRDVAILDSAVRFQLLATDEATLKERLQMEEILCSIQRFSQVDYLADKLPTMNRALAKVYATVVHLRSIAHRLVLQNPRNDISEYYIALLYSALNTLRFSTLPSGQREHAVLSASLLADRLGLSS